MHNLAKGDLPGFRQGNNGLRSRPGDIQRTGDLIRPLQDEVGSHFDVVPADPEAWSKDRLSVLISCGPR